MNIYSFVRSLMLTCLFSAGLHAQSYTVTLGNNESVTLPAGTVYYLPNNRPAELIQAIIDAGYPLVLNFSASWCGPCRAIAPSVSNEARKYPHVIVLKIDVDAFQAIAHSHGVRSMPTFKFYKHGDVVASFAGADPGQIQSAFQKCFSA